MKTQISSTLTIEHDDVGQGRPLILLHAFPLAGAMWQPQIEALQDELRLIVPDLRGFGGTSGFDGPASIEQMAGDVAALLHALRIDEPVALCGLSMGGYVALAFARKFPEKLRGLILADTRAEADTVEGKAKRDEMIEFARAHAAREVVEQMLPRLTFDESRRRRAAAMDEVLRIGAAQTTKGIIDALQALRDRPDARPDLQAIKVPTLVIVGAQDTLTPPSMARTLAEGISQAQLVTIERAGHLSNLEQPEAFNSAIQAFLRGLA